MQNNQISLFSIDWIFRIKEKREFLKQARAIEKLVISSDNLYLIYRLALELDSRDFQTKRLQNFLINKKATKYILKIAREFKNIDVQKLQKTILQFGSDIEIAKFGVFVAGADKEHITNIIANSGSAKSAYLLLKFSRYPNLDILKKIFFQSKKPRYLFTLAKKLKNKKDIEHIAELILNSSSPTYIRLFASKFIDFINLNQFEDKIIEIGTPEDIKKFSVSVKNSNKTKKLVLLL